LYTVIATYLFVKTALILCQLFIPVQICQCTFNEKALVLKFKSQEICILYEYMKSIIYVNKLKDKLQTCLRRNNDHQLSLSFVGVRAIRRLALQLLASGVAYCLCVIWRVMMMREWRTGVRMLNCCREEWSLGSSGRSSDLEQGNMDKTNVDKPKYYYRYLNDKPLFLELAIVFDNSMYEKFGRDKNALKDRASQIATLVNSLFQPVNIRVALVGVEIWSDKDAFPVRQLGEDALSNFVHYRQHRLLYDMPNDVAVLITNISFQNGVVGKALQSTLCSVRSSGAVVSDHSHDVLSVAITVAHEIGHNFGMEHDNATCECPLHVCIMAPMSGASHTLHWSSCSLEYLSWSLKHGSETCLQNEPTNIINGPLCGNGFLEEGEQCDCGLPHICDNPCCNPKTCKFNADATCANGACCDLSTCQPKRVGTVCRHARGECDLSEHCDGKSEFCPNDTYKQDGTLCKSGETHCFHGDCKTLDDQCKLLWGESGRPANPLCYSMNSEGNVYGNCGVNRFNDTYTVCQPQNMKCGLLQCEHRNEKTTFGSKSTVLSGSTVLRQGSNHFSCNTAMVDLGVDSSDPGLVPGGTFCGPGKMCANQKCVTVSSILEINRCPNECNNVGVCNNLGHCYCDVGYGGIDCTIAGPGGSIDSGPASAPGSIFPSTAILVFVFVALPALFAILTYLHRRGIFKASSVRLLKTMPMKRKASRKSKLRKVSSWVTDGTLNHPNGVCSNNAMAPSALSLPVGLPKPPAHSPPLPPQGPVKPNNVYGQDQLFGQALAKPFHNPTQLVSSVNALKPASKAQPPPCPPPSGRLSGERIYVEMSPERTVPLQMEMTEKRNFVPQLKEALSVLPSPGVVIPQRRAPAPPPPLPPQPSVTSVASSSPFVETCISDVAPNHGFSGSSTANSASACHQKSDTKQVEFKLQAMTGACNKNAPSRPAQAPPPPPVPAKPKAAAECAERSYDRIAGQTENLATSQLSTIPKSQSKVTQLAAKFDAMTGQ
ncbi:Disintegrin and metalloproteinase domain-containing protein 12, partial [Trichinella spiralis]